MTRGPDHLASLAGSARVGPDPRLSERFGRRIRLPSLAVGARSPVAVACALVACALPANARAQATAGAGAKPADAQNARGNVALVIGGFAALAVTQGVPLAVAADYDFHDGGGWFAVPIAGPWVYLARREGCTRSEDQATGAICAFGNTMLVLAVVTDGLAQLASGATIAAGFLVPADLGEPRRATVAVRPTATPTAHGWVVGVSGEF